MSDETYDFFGQIAIRNRFTSFQQLQEGLEYQAEEDPYKAIGQILFDRGYITDGAINAVLQVQGQLRNPEENDPFRAANDLGKRIIKLGFAEREQVIECLKLVKVAMKASQPAPNLTRLLHEKGYLGEEQLLKLDQGWDDQGFPRIEGYKMLQELRSGGMGTVYQARQIAMHRIVALKILRPKLSRIETHVRRFMEEARAQARLSHQNIVGAIEAGQSRGMCYFVMEFINGDSVMEMINRDGPLKLRRALVITYEIARALEHVHAHRIIHRDIKPSNIMVNHKGVSKLCDLGFAKIDDEDVMVGMAGTTLGTPYYMSPEQARGRADLDGRSDLYSLGASLFHMLTRRAPFYGKNASAVMRKQITEPLNFRTREISLFGDDVVAIVQRMMAKDRDERYQSARDVMEALAPFLGHETIGTDLRHDSSSMTQLLAVEKAQILVIHDSLEGTPEVEAVLSGITREGFSPSVCSVEDLDEKELMSSDGVLIGIPDGKLSDAVEQLLQGTEALDGKVAGVFICGDSTSGGAALQAVQEGLLAAGTVLQGGLRGYLGQTKEPRDEGLYRAALEILGKQVCELARQRVAVGEV